MGVPAIQRAVAAGVGSRAAKVAELAASAKAAPPAPPVPAPFRPAAGERYGPPTPQAGDTRYNEAMAAVSSLPQPPEGHTRLYRVGVAGTPEQPKTVKYFGQDIPHDEYVKQRRLLLQQTGGRDTNPPEAAGRWFGKSPESMHWYLQREPGDPVHYVDVPEDMARQWNVRNTPYAASSLDPDAEFVLPHETAVKAPRLLDRLLDPQ